MADGTHNRMLDHDAALGAEQAHFAVTGLGRAVEIGAGEKHVETALDLGQPRSDAGLLLEAFVRHAQRKPRP